MNNRPGPRRPGQDIRRPHINVMWIWITDPGHIGPMSDRTFGGRDAAACWRSPLGSGPRPGVEWTGGKSQVVARLATRATTFVRPGSSDWMAWTLVGFAFAIQFSTCWRCYPRPETEKRVIDALICLETGELDNMSFQLPCQRSDLSHPVAAGGESGREDTDDAPDSRLTEEEDDRTLLLILFFDPFLALPAALIPCL
jgi:hypothetical protein